MARLVVDIGTNGREKLRQLEPGQRVFIERWLQTLHDETHPHWALRPLSLGTLQNLYPAKYEPRSRQLSWATEDELCARWNDKAADANTLALTSHSHKKAKDRHDCSTCRAALTAASAVEGRLASLSAELLRAIQDNDVPSVMALTPVVAAEAIARRVPPRYLLQTCKNYVLDVQGKRRDTFKERLTGFLRHDVGGEPRTAPPASPPPCVVRRNIDLDLPGAAAVPPLLGPSAAVQLQVEKDGGQSTRRLWLRKDTPNQLSSREAAATELRSATPGWIAILQFVFADILVRPMSAFHAQPPDTFTMEMPGHRNIVSRRETGATLHAMALLIENETLRASLYWASKAYQVWGESVAHAAGMTWMAIESLIGSDDAVERAARAYREHLVRQLAGDLEDTLASLFGDAHRRNRPKRTPPAWLNKLPPRFKFPTDEEWMDALVGTIDADDDPLLAEVIRDCQLLASHPPHWQRAQEEAARSLAFLRATRHAIAHHGKSSIEEPLAHYLATLGCECLHAFFAEALVGTAWEGRLEGRSAAPGRGVLNQAPIA